MLCPSCFQEKRADQRVCPQAQCGFDEAAPRDSRLLPYRHTLQRGRYTMGVVLGKPGGFGVAYKAYDARRSGVVVVKECLLTDSGQVTREPGDPRLQINPGFAAEHRKWLDYFLQEGRLIQRFTHPCIVRVIDIFEENRTAYYVMPFVEGEDLVHHCAAHGGKLPEAQVMQIAQQLLSALVEIHGTRYVHRDIKPSNVLITRKSGKPVLIDFGAARKDFGDERSRSHQAMHTRSYAPLEQVTSDSNQGPWTDLYSLSATLYYCLVGEPPVESGRRREQVPDPFVPVHLRLPKLDSRLSTVIDNGLALAVDKRLKSAAQALQLLGTTAEPASVHADTGPTPGPLQAAAPPPATGAPAPPPLPALVLLMPAGIALAWAALVSQDFFDALFGWPGLIALVNVTGWGWWRARRSYAERSGATGARTGADFTGRAGGSASTSGSSLLDAEPESVVGIELQLQTEGVAPLIRLLRPGETLVVGRTARADLAIPNQWLSGRHASIAVTEDGEFDLRDLGSLNHTYQYRRGQDSEAGAWIETQAASGRKGRFMFGPPDGGVRLDIRQTRVPL